MSTPALDGQRCAFQPRERHRQGERPLIANKKNTDRPSREAVSLKQPRSLSGRHGRRWGLSQKDFQF